MGAQTSFEESLKKSTKINSIDEEQQDKNSSEKDKKRQKTQSAVDAENNNQLIQFKRKHKINQQEDIKNHQHCQQQNNQKKQSNQCQHQSQMQKYNQKQNNQQQIIKNDKQQLSSQPKFVLITKKNIFLLCLTFLMLVCVGLLITLFAISGNYFAFLFSQLSQAQARAYLRQNFNKQLAFVYLSMVLMIVVVADTVISFFALSFKPKLIYLHLIAYLCFLISGILTVTNYSYSSYLNSLIASCVSSFTFECPLIQPYFTSTQQIIVYFSTSAAVIPLYIALFQYGAVKINPTKYQVHASTKISLKHQSQQSIRQKSIKSQQKQNKIEQDQSNQQLFDQNIFQFVVRDEHLANFD